MEINRHNYEIYAIDFIEGQMSPSEAAVFIAFLADNPDIAHEVELMRDSDTESRVSPIHQDFSFLKKDYSQITIGNNNFEEVCIAYHEGDLNENIQKKLIAFISNDPERQKIFNTYGQLKIVPDEGIIFKSGNSLKRKTFARYNPRRIALITTMAAAASLAMVFIFRHNTADTAVQSIAQTSVNKVQKALDSNTEVSVAKVEDYQHVKKTKNLSTKKRIKPEKTEANESMIAAVSDSSDSEVVRLARIEPRPIQRDDQSELIIFSLPKVKINELTVKEEQRTIEEIREKKNVLVTKASNLSVDHIIKSGINGINSLAETDLSYKSQTDDKGRITEFALSTESFNIKRRIRNN